MHSEHERYYGLGLDALVIGLPNALEHERDDGLGMDAMVIVCTRNTNAIMVCTWMHL